MLVFFMFRMIGIIFYSLNYIIKSPLFINCVAESHHTTLLIRILRIAK